MSDIAELFAEEGVLARALHGYRPRAGQIEMARAMNSALTQGGQHVFEAGTGIGKTFAYLAPILHNRVSALISTSSLALQDQLSQRDVPQVAAALGRSVSLAVLKGRGNYVCKKALREHPASGELLPENEGDWEKITLFAATSEDGDIHGIRDVPSTSPLLREAVSTRASCTVQECEYYKECFLYKARARAQQADLVIVNHHLFLSDMRLRDEGVSEILPSREVVLFDEAHILPQVAPQFFGEQFSTRQTLDMLPRLKRFVKKDVRDSAPLTAAVIEIEAAVEQLLAETNNALADGRETRANMLPKTLWCKAAAQLHERLQSLMVMLENRAPQHEKLLTYAQQTKAHVNTLGNWLTPQPGDEDANEIKEIRYPLPDAAEDMSTVTEGAGGAKAAKSAKALAAEKAAEEDDPLVRWAEFHAASGNLTLHSAPMTGRLLLARQWENVPLAVFTSATLSIGGDFNDFCETAGLAAAQTHSWDSPYDFRARALLYLPDSLPQPTPYDDSHALAVADTVLPLIRANGGRAFLLFSSWRALNAAHDYLLQPLLGDNMRVLKQQEMPNDKLLECFRAEPRAVLMGTKSFWQGVDVRGEALSLLVVDKIPFTPPIDPLLQARDEWRKRRKENAFMRNQLPPAVLLMKQVAGRLLRDYDDYGVFVMADPRLLTKGYGRTIIDALPPFRVTRDAQKAEAFLKKMRENSEGANG